MIDIAFGHNSTLKTTGTLADGGILEHDHFINVYAMVDAATLKYWDYRQLCMYQKRADLAAIKSRIWIRAMLKSGFFFSFWPEDTQKSRLKAAKIVKGVEVNLYKRKYYHIAAHRLQLKHSFWKLWCCIPFLQLSELDTQQRKEWKRVEMSETQTVRLKYGIFDILKQRNISNIIMFILKLLSSCFLILSPLRWTPAALSRRCSFKSAVISRDYPRFGEGRGAMCTRNRSTYELGGLGIVDSKETGWPTCPAYISAGLIIRAKAMVCPLQYVSKATFHS